MNLPVNEPMSFTRAVSIMEDLATGALRAGLFKELEDPIIVNAAIKVIKSRTHGTNETRQSINNSGKSNTAVGPDNRIVQAKKAPPRSRKLPAGSATTNAANSDANGSQPNGHDAGGLMQNDLPFIS